MQIGRGLPDFRASVTNLPHCDENMTNGGNPPWAARGFWA
jgi:hypothetical protein